VQANATAKLQVDQRQLLFLSRQAEMRRETARFNFRRIQSFELLCTSSTFYENSCAMEHLQEVGYRFQQCLLLRFTPFPSMQQLEY
jgi:hypothetical protein